MPYANSIVYIDTTNNLGVSIGDVQAVTGSSSNDVGGLCQFSGINRWSKWKPFRSSAIGFSTAADQLTAMKTVNMGFTIPTASVSSNTITNTEWTYNKPRGLANSEYFRLPDFAPLEPPSSRTGYYHLAVCPLATWWPDSLTNRGRNRIILFVDQQVNSTSSAWNSDTCVSFLDCVDGSNNAENNYGDYYICLLIADNSGGSNSNVLLSSGITVDALAAMPTKLIMFDFCAYEAPAGAQEGCIVLPEYTFADTKIGDSFDIAWVLAPLSEGVTYMTTNFPTMISLNLEDGVNMANLELAQADSIDGLVGNITGTLTRISGVTDTYGGNTYLLYRLDDLSVYLDTTNADWDVTDITLGTISDRSVVYIELGTMGVLGDSYIMTSDTNLSTYNTIRPSILDPGSSSTYRYYEPTTLNCLFDVAKGKTPAIATVALDDPSNVGTGSTLPYIYLWAREDQVQSSVAGIELNGTAYSDRTRAEAPFTGTGERIIFNAENLIP